MAILNLHLNLKPEYKDLLDDFVKFTVILLIFHTLLGLSQGSFPNNLGLTGDLYNNDFITLFIFLLVSVYVYHMIFKRLVEIN